MIKKGNGITCVAPCEVIKDNLGFRILRFGFLVSGTWIADSSSVELGFRIPIVSWIPDSLS